MQVVLKPIDPHSVEERKEVVRFVNTHYASPLPLEESAISSGKIRFFRAYDGEWLVGVCGYMVKTPFLAESVKTVVDPDHREKGYGWAISVAIEDEVRRAGFKKIMSTIYTTNIPMIIIKLKQGYFFEGFHPNHEMPGLHEYSFGKLLEIDPYC